MNFWKIQNNQVQNAELQLYGEISNDDFSWWDGRQYITSKKFLEDIETIKNKKEITIKLNSGGGDLFVGLQIANVLRGISAKKICIIEGIAASAATLIACVCDEVKLYRNSLFMVHKPKAGFFDFGEDKDFDKVSNMLKACKNSSIELYKQKTGKSDKELSDVVENETWFIGQEAVDFGFCDAVIDQNLAVEVTESGFFIVNSIAHNLANCKNYNTIKQKMTKKTVISKKGEKETMSKDMTIETLQKEYPVLYNAILMQERNRLKELDNIALYVDAEMLHNAKYIAAMSAKDLCYNAMKQGKINTINYQKDCIKDRQNSGVQNVVGGQSQENEKQQQRINHFANVLNQKRGVKL